MIGVMQHDMSVGVAGETYTLLTIGDGLVAQIPGLVISTAAGVVVTRVANDRGCGRADGGPAVYLSARDCTGGRRDWPAGPDPRHA